MRYIRMSLRFLKHNALRLLLSAAIASLLLAFVVDLTGMFRFVRFVSDPDTHSFGQIIRTVFGIASPWWPAGVFCMVVFSAVPQSDMLGTIHRRMTFGDVQPFSLRYLWNKINNYFLPILQISALFCGIMLLDGFLLAVFCYLWAKLSTVVAIVLSLITGVILIGIAVLAVSLVLTMLPNMTIKGYGFAMAFRISVTACSKKLHTIFASVALPVLVAFIPVSLIGILDFPGAFVLRYLISALFLFAMHLYIVPLMYVVFYDTEEMDRQDDESLEWGRED